MPRAAPTFYILSKNSPVVIKKVSEGIEIADGEEIVEHSIRIGEGTREIFAEMVTEDGA